MEDQRRTGGIEGAYDAWSDTYDNDINRTRDLDGVILRRRSLHWGLNIVELGCGTARNTAWLASHGRALVGLDISPGMLQRAQGRSLPPGVRLLRCDITGPWPLRDQWAHLVVANLVLEHVERLGPVLAEAHRVLRPGGHVLLSELHPYRQYRGSQARFGAPGEEVRIPSHIHHLSDYMEASGRAGLTLVDLGEWWDNETDRGYELPRLLTLDLGRA